MPRILSRGHIGPRRSSDPGNRFGYGSRRFSAGGSSSIVSKPEANSDWTTSSNSSSSELSKGTELTGHANWQRRNSLSGTNKTMRRAPSVGWGQYVEFSEEVAAPTTESAPEMAGSPSQPGRESSNIFLSLLKGK